MREPADKAKNSAEGCGLEWCSAGLAVHSGLHIIVVTSTSTDMNIIRRTDVNINVNVDMKVNIKTNLDNSKRIHMNI